MKQTPGIFRDRFAASAAILTWTTIVAGLLLCGYAVMA